MSAFYNENDPKTAAWLRELIKQNLIAPGVVDERSIADIKPHELDGFTQCHFFAGIGGWSYALRLAGIADEEEVCTGSCPCQPLSCAGLGKGHADERHLWPAFYALIAERRFPVVFGEQVAPKAGREWFAGIRADLEGMGYAVGGADLCAASVNSPHPRPRIYWVAHDPQQRRGQGSQDGRGRSQGSISPEGRARLADRSEHGRLGDTSGERRGETRRDSQRSKKRRTGTSEACGMGHAGCQGFKEQPGQCDEPSRHGAASRRGHWDDYDICHFTGADEGKARRIEPGTFPLDHGLPARMVRLRGYGNAIVPQVAAQFIQAAYEAIG